MKLEGLKVLDLSAFLPGPHMTMMMADHGADVVMVEPANGIGEPTRVIGHTTPDGVLTYGWLGVPHRSASYRTHYVLTGGRPVALSALGLEVTGFVGFGYAAPELLTTRLARSGSIFDRINLVERTFTISGLVRDSKGC